MTTAHVPGTGIATGDAAKHGRRTAMIAGVVLAFAAIVVPFGVHGLRHGGAETSPAAPGATARPVSGGQHDRADDPALGAHDDLPPLLPARSGVRDGLQVRVGDITEGTVRRTPTRGWQVMVRWDGRLQPLATRGPISLGDGTSWVSRSGLLYTRLPTETADRFHVYAWDPQGGTAYTPPTLVADDLGRVCFNSSFTAFGDCGTAG